MLLYTNIKNYKNIACIDILNVNIALNSHNYDKHESFTEFIKVQNSFIEFIKMIYLKLLSETVSHDHMEIVLMLHTFHSA